MASARCETCGSPKGLKQNYTHSHSLAYPERFLCGAPTCTRFALIWLTEEEEQCYAQGVRLFRLSNRAVEAQVA